MSDISVSGSANPYDVGYYTVQENDKNTLSIASYFKLLAAQLANQDATNPMSNSEMMAQMTQMAMVESMTAMTESIETTSAINTSTYAASLMGQEITVAVTEEGPYGQPVAVGVKYGKVVSVNLTNGVPVIKIEGDDKEYPLSYVLGMGQIEDPFVDKEETEEGNSEGGATEGATEGEASDKSKHSLFDSSLLG